MRTQGSREETRPGIDGAPGPRLNRRRVLATAISGALAFGMSQSLQAQFPAVLALSGLDGSDGFRIDGLAASDRLGRSVSNAGDVNGDGFDDLVIGASEASPNGVSRAGSAFVLFGRETSTQGQFPAILNVSLLNGGTGFRVDGLGMSDQLGRSVSGAGDVNGDGIDDLIIAAPVAEVGDQRVGSSYVIFGRNVSKTGDFPSNLDLTTLDGTNGFRVDGVATSDRAGGSVSAAGDLNGDGIDDLVIGAYAASPGGANLAGSSYVVFGKDVAVAGDFPPVLGLASLAGSNGFRLDGSEENDQSGRSVSQAGDINGDGIDDVIIGAGTADPGGEISAGSSYVVFGRAGGFPATLALSSLDGDTGFRLDGSPYDLSGYSVSAAGDVNGDGFDDLVIGGPDSRVEGTLYAGRGFVVFGRDAGASGSFAPVLSLATLDGSNGFRLNGVSETDLTGVSVDGAGDISGDGIADLVIGAPGLNSYAGGGYVVFGRSETGQGGFPASIDLATLDGESGFRLDGNAVITGGRGDVSRAGDINGDGADDIVIGIEVNSPDGNDRAGSAYIVFGRRPNSIFADRFEF